MKKILIFLLSLAGFQVHADELVLLKNRQTGRELTAVCYERTGAGKCVDLRIDHQATFDSEARVNHLPEFTEYMLDLHSMGGYFTSQLSCTTFDFACHGLLTPLVFVVADVPSAPVQFIIGASQNAFSKAKSKRLYKNLVNFIAGKEIDKRAPRVNDQNFSAVYSRFVDLSSWMDMNVRD